MLCDPKAKHHQMPAGHHLGPPCSQVTKPFHTVKRLLANTQMPHIQGRLLSPATGPREGLPGLKGAQKPGNNIGERRKHELEQERTATSNQPRKETSAHLGSQRFQESTTQHCEDRYTILFNSN